MIKKSGKKLRNLIPSKDSLKKFVKNNYRSLSLIALVATGLGAFTSYKLTNKDYSKDDLNLNIEITQDGFKQYNNGLLTRELKGEITKDMEYNSKRQMIKSTSSNGIGKLESTFYNYDEEGLKNREDHYPAKGFMSGSSSFIYKRNEQDSIVEEERHYSNVNGKYWTEIRDFDRDENGIIIGVEKRLINNQIDYSLKDKDRNILARDYDGDGKIDAVEKR